MLWEHKVACSSHAIPIQLLNFMEYLLFYLFSSIALLSGIQVILSVNSVNSVLFLILVFINATGLMLLLQVEFMALIFLVVYVGAIAVLFLFVVMMIAPKHEEIQETSYGSFTITFLLGSIFLIEFYLVVNDGIVWTSVQDTSQPHYTSWITLMDSGSMTNLETIGQVLYTYYIFYFLLAGFILLVAMIGAIVLTLHARTPVKENVISKRQHVFEQLSRSSDHAIFETRLKE